MSEEMLLKAKRLLAESCYSDISKLSCHIEDDFLVITGQVQSWYNKQMAQETIRSLGLRISNKAQVLSKNKS